MWTNLRIKGYYRHEILHVCAQCGHTATGPLTEVKVELSDGSSVSYAAYEDRLNQLFGSQYNMRFSAPIEVRTYAQTIPECARCAATEITGDGPNRFPSLRSESYIMERTPAELEAEKEANYKANELAAQRKRKGKSRSIHPKTPARLPSRGLPKHRDLKGKIKPLNNITELFE